MKLKNRSFIGVILAFVAGALWGHSGLFVRILSEEKNVGSVEISTMRVILTFLMMLIWVLIVDRQAIRIEKKHILYFVGSGLFGMFGCSMLYFLSITMCSLALSAILMYTAPIFVVIISVFVFKQKLTFKKAICCVFAIFGAAMVSGIFAGVDNVSVLGIIFGAGSGLSYALYSVFSSLAVTKGAKPYSVTLYSFFFAMLGVLCCCNMNALVGHIKADYTVLLIALFQAFLSCLMPYILYTLSMKYIDASTASIVSIIEIVVSTVVGALKFGETLSYIQVSGVAVVVVAIIILNSKLFEKKKLPD